MRRLPRRQRSGWAQVLEIWQTISAARLQAVSMGIKNIFVIEVMRLS